MDKEKYNELLRNIWKKTLPFLGAITMEGIFRRIIKKREVQYPYLSKISLSENGFDILSLDGDNIKEGMNLIVIDFYKFLEEMTGNIVTNEMDDLIKEVLNEEQR
ncbi:MAG: hypothetical protein AB1630_04460 [bacterium]